MTFFTLFIFYNGRQGSCLSKTYTFMSEPMIFTKPMRLPHLIPCDTIIKYSFMFKTISCIQSRDFWSWYYKQHGKLILAQLHFQSLLVLSELWQWTKTGFICSQHLRLLPKSCKRENMDAYSYVNILFRAVIIRPQSSLHALMVSETSNCNSLWIAVIIFVTTCSSIKMAVNYEAFGTMT